MTLARDALDGNRLALAQILTQVENRTDLGKSALQELFPHTGKAHIIGVTGAPGTGKSTLVNAIAKHIRSPHEGEVHMVGIIAVDPSSPFTGGAILGDRVRMKDLAGDRGVFVRSMATRGSIGGLAATTSAMTQVFDAVGYDWIIIETVGAGQAEVDIATIAHSVIVVEAPGFGDDIQAIKAGILEIADLLVINKADLPGADTTERALKANLDHYNYRSILTKDLASLVDLPDTPLHPGQEGWQPPILRTIATDGTGISGVIQSVEAHKEHLKKLGLWQEKETARLLIEVKHILMDKLYMNWIARVSEERLRLVIQEVLSHSKSPSVAVDELIGNDDLVT
jgi:LAO/AO transport system kinase